MKSCLIKDKYYKNHLNYIALSYFSEYFSNIYRKFNYSDVGIPMYTNADIACLLGTSIYFFVSILILINILSLFLVSYHS